MIRFVAGFLAGLLAALVIASPVSGGRHNCTPAWKCAPRITTTPTTIVTQAPTVAPTLAPTQAPTAPPSIYPPDRSPLRSLTNPAVPTMALRVPVTEPVFGTQRTRVSNPGQQHVYSRLAAWNSDGSLLVLDYPPTRVMLDGRTFAVLKTSPPKKQQWSNVNPNISYGYANDRPRDFYAIDWRDGSSPYSITLPFDSVTLGDGEACLSNDDRLVALMTVKAGQQGVVILDIPNRTVGPVLNLPSRPNWASISQLGRHVVIGWNSPGSGQGLGTWAYDVSGLTLVNARQISTTTSHSDMAIAASGHDSWVAVEEGPGFYDLETNTWTRLFGGISNILWSGHVSARNTKYPGWAVFSSYRYRPGQAGNDQIVAAKLDGSGIVREYGWLFNRADPAPYDLQPMAVPSPDMTRIAVRTPQGEVVWGMP